MAGEVLQPLALILPVNETAYLPTVAGEIFLSGGVLYWYDGSSVQTLAGSNSGD